MDTKTQYETFGSGIKNAIITTNEARKKVGYGKKPGGDSIFLQQQYYSLEALAKRDAKEDPFAAKQQPAPPPPPEAQTEEPDAEQERVWHPAEYVAALKRA